MIKFNYHQYAVLADYKDEGINFKHFARSIMEDEFDRAIHMLQSLLDLDYEKAKNSTIHFSAQLDQSPEVIVKTMLIRGMVLENNYEDAVKMVQEIFHIYGVDAVRAVDQIAVLLGENN
jgi:hypothetical protein